MMTLFAKDDVIRDRLGLGDAAWRKVLAAYHNDPAFLEDPLTGLRFWPAIERYFMQRWGLTEATMPFMEDGKENWPDDPPKPSRRSRSRAP